MTVRIHSLSALFQTMVFVPVDNKTFDRNHIARKCLHAYVILRDTSLLRLNPCATAIMVARVVPVANLHKSRHKSNSSTRVWKNSAQVWRISMKNIARFLRNATHSTSAWSPSFHTNSHPISSFESYPTTLFSNLWWTKNPSPLSSISVGCHLSQLEGVGAVYPWLMGFNLHYPLQTKIFLYQPLPRVGLSKPTLHRAVCWRWRWRLIWSYFNISWSTRCDRAC